MEKAGKQFRLRLVGLPRWGKRLVLVLADFATLSVALWAALSLRLSTAYTPPDATVAALLVLAPVIGVVTFYARGLYRLVTRYIGDEAATQIYITIALGVLIWALVLLMLGNPGVPRSVIIIYWLLASALIRLNRHFAGWVLKADPSATPATLDPRPKVLIYGAGSAGQQLLQVLRHSPDYAPVAFVDDDQTLWGQRVQKLKVYSADKIERLLESHSVKEIFLAISSAPLHERRAVIRALEPFPVVVKTLPALEDITSGRIEISDLRPIDVDDLLGRDPVPPDTTLMTRDITGKSVMITGAGGSIGSELTRQILQLDPKRLVLFELSETALYEMESEVADILAQRRAEGAGSSTIEVVAVLGSVLDEVTVRHTLEAHDVATIYHAAAYKHVPIVEENPVAGLRNNTLGTLVLARAAEDLGVSRMVLISTDKAVRPTSVMGASKRLAELVLQGMADSKDCRTIFTMVRFGNVLDSSGSVVRRFRQQIQDGGPVTVTHPDMIRYFMSIPEAAQLVIQAGAMATGGEVFVLDMGTPVKIDDLARTMIRLSGLEVRDDAHPEGDIAIRYIGLRQGEKLYEELLIGDNTTGTKHPRVMKNSEPFIPVARLREELDKLTAALDAHHIKQIEDILRNTVEDYSASTTLSDTGPSGPDAWPAQSRTLH